MYTLHTPEALTGRHLSGSLDEPLLSLSYSLPHHSHTLNKSVAVRCRALPSHPVVRGPAAPASSSSGWHPPPDAHPPSLANDSSRSCYDSGPSNRPEGMAAGSAGRLRPIGELASRCPQPLFLW